jgi:hypothetical protein
MYCKPEVPQVCKAALPKINILYLSGVYDYARCFYSKELLVDAENVEFERLGRLSVLT